jgi:succinyl-CoA synthetase beta subunit
MRIFEYQGKALLKGYGIPVPDGSVIGEKREIAQIVSRVDKGNGVLLKAQILTGRAGLEQGVRFAQTVQQCEAHYDELINLVMSGSPVRTILLEEGIEGRRDFCLGLLIDTDLGQPVLVIGTQGGWRSGGIDRIPPGDPGRMPVDIGLGLMAYQVRSLLIGLGLPESLYPQFIDLSLQLYRLFREKDLLCIEIDPLVLDGYRRLVAVGVRIEADAAALFRNHEIAEMKASRDIQIGQTLDDDCRLDYVALDGNIGVIGIGTGLTLTLIDSLAAEGGRPACYLDVSGNISPIGYEVALRTLKARPEIDCVLMNLFGGYYRMDRAAADLLEALRRIGGFGKPLVIRIEGTDAASGRRRIQEAGFATCDTLEEAVKKAVMLGGSHHGSADRSIHPGGGSGDHGTGRQPLYPGDDPLRDQDRRRRDARQGGDRGRGGPRLRFHAGGGRAAGR